MKKALLLFFTICSIHGYAQDVLMQNGTITTCSGVFYDSGGALSNYSNNENLVLTICPEIPGERIRLSFQEFATELNVDVINIYNGDSTDDALHGVFSGTSSPLTFTASLDSPTGCLTFEFISNESGNTSGWAADISCTTPCQDITAQLDSTLPLPNGEGIIEVCTGENITLNGSGVFGVDGTGATYTWNLGDGNTANGQSTTFSYNMPGVYFVDFHIRDTNTDNIVQGCPSNNAITQIIRVSGEPDFSGTQAENATLCFGDTTTIEGVVNPLTLLYNCPPPESEETFLPDGSGAAYSTCINVTCFDSNAVLTNVSQILDICLNMEHSYSGDLDIKIISPNGQEADLFVQGGGNTYFGGANDDNGTAPGVGADYCFSMAASVPLLDANTIMAGSNPPDLSWEPGTYLPVESFDGLIGSPLNGEWCIQIVDNLSIDNGYIFSWELNFDPSVPQEDFSFIPAIISQSWDADSSITQVNGNTITVAPAASGEYCYTYRTIDVFGCEFTEEVCITVADENQPPVIYYADTDSDGYGDANNSIVECSSVPPNGYSANNLDCDDTSDVINPGAPDSDGNGVDENCDGVDGDALSVDDNNSKDVSIQPNPFGTSITINLPVSLNGNELDIKIYDLNGRSVYDKNHLIMDGVISINGLDNLARAPYFIKMSNREVRLTVIKKLIKL
ncbi:PKD domain-containing protein [uncultured Psychroserpens sp.]|uniref:PKD domain-containing protein n=1 Tax=uncultured Psychroserpens sp. TaxID=255436 RepID=UPI00261C2676|nr:PKD domain-containing protein [uncultured Psychroserpens sp.]